MRQTHQIELSANLVTTSTRCCLFTKHSLAHCNAWIECPCGIASVKIHDSAQVVAECNIHVKSTRDQTSGLEEVVVILCPSLFGHSGRQALFGLVEATILVYGCELFNDIVVEAYHRSDRSHGTTYCDIPIEHNSMLQLVLSRRYRERTTYNSTPHAGGIPRILFSEKQSGFNFPSLNVRI